MSASPYHTYTTYIAEQNGYLLLLCEQQQLYEKQRAEFYNSDYYQSIKHDSNACEQIEVQFGLERGKAKKMLKVLIQEMKIQQAVKLQALGLLPESSTKASNADGEIKENNQNQRSTATKSKRPTTAPSQTHNDRDPYGTVRKTSPRKQSTFNYRAEIRKPSWNSSIYTSTHCSLKRATPRAQIS